MTVFQFYKDLDPLLNTATILGVTEGRRVNAVAQNGDGLYYDGTITPKAGAFLRAVNDQGIFLLEAKREVIAFDRAREIRLESSPVMRPVPICLNDEGFIGGHVVGPDSTFARIWARNGREILATTDPNTSIVALPPEGAALAIGTYGPFAAAFTRDVTRILRGPTGEPARATRVNGAGLIGGSFGSPSRAVVWDADGAPTEIAVEADESSVIAILEDGSIIVQSNAGYWIGRPGMMTRLDSSRLKSVEMFPLVSIDAVSPTGVMVVTLEEPVLKRHTRALVGPEAARRTDK